jgi:hypothetical protein
MNSAVASTALLVDPQQIKVPSHRTTMAATNYRMVVRRLVWRWRFALKRHQASAEFVQRP